MLTSIVSHAQAAKQQSDIKLRVIERVLSGEPFTISTDRMPRVYRFVYNPLEDLYHLLCDGGFLGRCDTNRFFPRGFVVTLHLLGTSQNHQVLTEHIRLATNTGTNGKGGAIC